MRMLACRLSGDRDIRSALTLVCGSLLVISVATAGWGQTPSSLYKATGTVASTEPTGFTLQTDAGVRLAVVIPNNALLLRVAPEEKTLKNATKISVADIAVGDRVLVQGQISSDQKTLVAVRAIDMSKAAIVQKHAAETAQWQRGVGGLVSAVDPVANTITISTSGFGGAKKTTVHVSKDTILRRYAPDSVKYEEAKPAPLSQIQPGDQLKARGTRSADGNDFDAQEIVSGTFLNIAGTVSSIDTTQNDAHGHGLENQETGSGEAYGGLPAAQARTPVGPEDRHDFQGGRQWRAGRDAGWRANRRRLRVHPAAMLRRVRPQVGLQGVREGKAASAGLRAAQEARERVERLIFSVFSIACPPRRLPI